MDAKPKRQTSSSPLLCGRLFVFLKSSVQFASSSLVRYVAREEKLTEAVFWKMHAELRNPVPIVVKDVISGSSWLLKISRNTLIRELINQIKIEDVSISEDLSVKLIYNGRVLIDNEIVDEIFKNATQRNIVYLFKQSAFAADMKESSCVDPKTPYPVIPTYDPASITAAREWLRDAPPSSDYYAVQRVFESMDASASVPPAAAPAPVPVWFNAKILIRIAFALLVFGRHYSYATLITTALLMYGYETGILSYLLRRIFNGRNALQPQANPNTPTPSLLSLLWTKALAMTTVHPPTADEVNPQLRNLYYLVTSFLFSLYPQWNPMGMA